MDNKEILEILDKYEARSSHPQLPVVWEKAKGSTVYGNGRQYIDFTSGIFVTNSGHSAINKALISQINKGLIYSYTFPTEIKAKFIKKLMKIVPNYLEKVALLNTGAEAVEIALKLMRLLHNKRNIIKNRGYYISIRGAMHGKTALTTALRGVMEHDEVYTIPYPNKSSTVEEDFDRVNPYEIYGIIIESYQGWSAKFLPQKYIQDLVKWANDNNIPICFDEVQAGFWRTGKLFAYEHYEVEPDLVCVGKGLGGGVPISAVLGKAKLLDMADDLTSTFSGNPLCCAGALENLKQLEKMNMFRLKNNEMFFKKTMEEFKDKYPIIKQVNCTGLVGALIFKDTKTATEFCRLAETWGLLVVYTARNSVKLGPPLTISIEDLLQAYYRIERCLIKLSPKKTESKYAKKRK